MGSEMNFEKVLRDMPLGKGGHEPGKGACVMEKVHMLWAIHAGRDVMAEWSDLPECTNEVVARFAQVVNDRLNSTERQRLNALIPRLLRARRTDSDTRVNVRLAVWAARRVLHLVREKDREVCERAIEAAEKWLETGAADAAAANAAYAAYAAAAAPPTPPPPTPPPPAAYAANAAANAANADAAAYAAAYAAYAAAAYAADAAAAYPPPPPTPPPILSSCWTSCSTPGRKR